MGITDDDVNPRSEDEPSESTSAPTPTTTSPTTSAPPSRWPAVVAVAALVLAVVAVALAVVALVDGDDQPQAPDAALQMASVKDELLALSADLDSVESYLNNQLLTWGERTNSLQHVYILDFLGAFDYLVECVNGNTELLVDRLNGVQDDRAFMLCSIELGDLVPLDPAPPFVG